MMRTGRRGAAWRGLRLASLDGAVLGVPVGEQPLLPAPPPVHRELVASGSLKAHEASIFIVGIDCHPELTKDLTMSECGVGEILRHARRGSRLRMTTLGQPGFAAR